MATLVDIANHVVNGTPYPHRLSNLKDTKNYQVLLSQTSENILQKVRNFVSNQLIFEEISKEINPHNAYQFLAAAKVVQMDTDSAKMFNSTYKIREFCAMNSPASTSEKSMINLMNAFSTPDSSFELDAFLANELDIASPVVTALPFGEPRNLLLQKIYNYSQKNAVVIPDIIPIIEKLMAERYRTMLDMHQKLPEATLMIYKGCSGSGKTYAIKQLSEKMFANVSMRKVVQSTDNVKKDLLDLLGQQFANQIHLLGFNLLKVLSETVKAKHASLSAIQEGWFHTTNIIDNLVNEASKMNLKLRIEDFDGSCEIVCLNVLARREEKLPLEQVIRSFKNSRESRAHLIKSLRPEDTYQFHFMDKDRSELVIDPSSLASTPEQVDQEIEQTKKTLITEEHVRLLSQLKPFLGLTIEEAFIQYNQ